MQVGEPAEDERTTPREPSLADALTAAPVGRGNGHRRSDVRRAARGALSPTLPNAPLPHAPYAVFHHASPPLSVLRGITGFTIEKIQRTESPGDPTESPSR